MTRIQYASGRESLCAVNLATTTGGTIAPGTYYFWLQGRNDVGYNLPSVSASITVSTGQAIELTIPEQAYLDRENWLRFAVLFNTEDDPTTASVLLMLEFFPTDITLPYVQVLSHPDHLTPEREVASFPSTNLINGLTLTRTSDGFTYYYKESNASWIRHYDGYNTGNLESTTDLFIGCDTNLVDIESSRHIINYDYAMDGSEGLPRKYWIFNDQISSFPKDRQFGITTTIQDVDLSSLFYNLLLISFEGYFDRTTGEYVTTKEDLTQFSYLDTDYYYLSNLENLVLEEDLDPNQAFQIKITPKFDITDLSFGLNLAPILSTVAIIPFIIPDQGSPTDLGEFLGDAILGNDSNLRRVYPSTGLSVFVDTGISLVADRLKRTRVSSQSFGFSSNLADQKLAINSAGTVYPITGALQRNERLRALVSSVAGLSKASDFSTIVEGNANPNIQITVNYPANIRANYDDVIAGSDKGVFNAEEVVLYVRKREAVDGAVVETREFLGLIPTNTISNDFNVLYEDGEIKLDALPDTHFGFWTAPTIADEDLVVENSIGGFFYDVSIAFKYNGLSITNISHKVIDGCIYEFVNNLAEIGAGFEASIYWRSPVDDRTLLSEIGVTQLQNKAIYPVVSAADDLPALYMLIESSTATVDGDQYLTVENGTGRFVKISGGSSTIPADALVDVSGEALTDGSGEILTF